MIYELALFAGAGGGILGSKLLGWTTRCAVEINPYCRRVLLARQRDKILPRFPLWDDIKSFDGRPWRGLIDVVTGGFPCQDISTAGKKAGITGSSSSLFFEMLRVTGEVRPTFVIAENSPNLRTSGLGTVVEGLTRLGYVGAYGVLGAWHIGAPHKRNRMWVVATHSDRSKLWEQPRWRCGSSRAAAPESLGDGKKWELAADPPPGCAKWWATEPDVGRVVDGVACRVDRLKAIGNGQVPLVAAAAWEILAPLAMAKRTLKST